MYRRIELMAGGGAVPRYEEGEPQYPSSLKSRGIGGIWKMIRLLPLEFEHPFTIPLKSPGRHTGKGYKSFFTEAGWDANGRKLVGWLNRDKVPFRIITVKEDSVDVMYEDKWQVAVRPRLDKDARMAKIAERVAAEPYEVDLGPDYIPFHDKSAVKVRPVAPHLKRTFEQGTLPLRRRYMYGDDAAFMDGKELHFGVISGGDAAHGIEVRTRDGKVFIVPKEDLRMPKGGHRGRDAGERTYG